MELFMAIMQYEGVPWMYIEISRRLKSAPNNLHAVNAGLYFSQCSIAIRKSDVEPYSINGAGLVLDQTGPGVYGLYVS